MIRRRHRGFSLEENLVATALFSLVTLLGVQLLTPCLHIFNRDQIQSRLDETAVITERNIERDVLPSAFKSLTANSQGFSFLDGGQALGQSEQFAPNSGSPMWQTFVVYYVQGNCLWRKLWAPSGMFPTMTCARLSSAQLVQAINTSNGTERVVAQNVQSSTFTLTSTLAVSAVLAAPGETSTFSFQVRPRL